MRRHLDGRADDRCALVDALLAGDEADVLFADPLAEAPVRLLREHPERARVDARPLLGELPERRVRLPGVRRAEVRDDPLRRRMRARASVIVMRRSAWRTCLRRSPARARCERLGRFWRPPGDRRPRIEPTVPTISSGRREPRLRKLQLVTSDAFSLQAAHMRRSRAPDEAQVTSCYKRFFRERCGVRAPVRATRVLTPVSRPLSAG